MILDKTRDGWFGASDTKFIMGNWDTKTFLDWWQVKLGIKTNNFSNIYTIAGNANESKIIDYLVNNYNLKLNRDRQIRNKKLRLRVNLDSETKDCIYEIKTFKSSDKEWKIPKAYIQQLQVQMFATRKYCGKIVAYELMEEDYDNFFIEIVGDRIHIFDIEYDNEWMQKEYLPRLVYLAKCLKNKTTPNIKEIYEKY